MAKMAVSADEVSAGRVILGLGAGWHDPEYDAFGFAKDHRVGRFEESLRIITPLLRGERVTVTGRYHRTRDARLFPPARRTIPILVAGEGPRILRLAARHADAWNTAWYGVPDDRLARQLAALNEALEDEGRDPGTMSKTVGMVVRDPGVDVPAEENEFAGSVEELADAIEAYARLGIDHLIVLLQPMTEPSLDRLGAALELCADLDPLRARGDGAHDRPCLVHPLDRPGLGLIEEMVEHPYRIKALRFGRSREGPDRRPSGRLARAVGLRGREDHADLHGAESRFDVPARAARPPERRRPPSCACGTMWRWEPSAPRTTAPIWR